jgi:hypothetical protein
MKITNEDRKLFKETYTKYKLSENEMAIDEMITSDILKTITTISIVCN